MKRKYVPVRWSEEVLERVKKEAGSRGLSISETVGILVRKSLDSSSVSVPTIDPETVRKEVNSGLKFGLEPVLKTLTLLRAEISGFSKGTAPDSIKSAPGPAPEIRPEIVRFLAEKVARLDALLEAVASKISGKSVEVVREEISVELSKSQAAGLRGNGPETIRFLAEKAARLDALLVGVSSKISGSNVGDHGDRMKQANVMAQYEIKKLFGG
ncbi:MAG: hypothetical protein ACYCYP_08195 [Leptospirales bacterium]